MKSTLAFYSTVLAPWIVQGVSATLPCSIDSFKSALPCNAAVVSAVSVANGTAYGEGAADIAYPTNPTNLPALCAVIVNVTTSARSNFRFGLFLPQEWNSRFLAVGNGGFLGGINWLDMGAGVRYGHAVVSTDTGHNATNADVSWATGNEGRKTDFGYRAMHMSVKLGKALVEAFYEEQIKYSYYSGGSTGGRQGLKEAQISPDSFDGMVIGAPAWYTSHLQTWTTKVATYNLPVTGENRVNASLFGVIGTEVIKQCDAADGLIDGIVSAPDRCNFTTDPLLCSAPGANATACLTPVQAATVNNIYSDYYVNGKFAFPGLEISSEAQWTPLLGQAKPSNLGDGYIGNFLFNDASWNWTRYNDSIVAIAEAVNPGNCTASDYDMRPFAERGGKMMLFHGYADGLIPVRSSDLFFQRLADASGGVDALQEWMRFMHVPGMQHVYGTAVDAPWYFAGPNSQAALGTDVFSVPGFEDPKHDILLALMNWVENGTAVEEIVATTWKTSTNINSGVLRQRPLCMWPKRQTYDGVGDPNLPASFACV
jgi:feruloyl esterase